MPKKKQPELDREEAQRVVDALFELLDSDQFKGKKAELGRALGIAGQALSQMLDDETRTIGKNSPSLATAKAVARLKNVSWTALVSGSDAGAEEIVDMYAHRAELRRLGEFKRQPIEVKRYVCGLTNQTGDYPSIDGWLTEMRSARARFDRGEKLTPVEDVDEVIVDFKD